jgi:type II secretory pathway pseudopilin PulG
MPVTRASNPPSHRPGERGFTLVEMLVAMVSGMVVILATLSILDISISQSARTTERVDANQRGRLAMEKILLDLHSTCTSYRTTPVEEESNSTKIVFLSQTGAEASFANIVKHVISLTEEGKLIDTYYVSNAGSGPNWSFPATPTGTQTLLTGVTQSVDLSSGATIPVFRYYKYVEGNLSANPLPVPLSNSNAEETAEVTVSFTAAPSFTAYHASAGTKSDRAVELSDTAVLRYDPASATGGNKSCE